MRTASDHSESGPEREVVGCCPLDCPDGCSWVVTVSDTPDGPVPVKLRGNPDHPFTAGSLCKKVNPWLEIAAEPGRLLHPLRRVGPKGSGREGFEVISWDEALAEIARRFEQIIDTQGPEAIWPFIGTGNVGSLQGANLGARTRFWNALGTSDHQVSICSVSGHIGLGYSMGSGTSLNPEDVVGARTIVIWGANPLVTGHHWWPFVERARKAGARVIAIDPVATRTARRCDWHIAPKVGTDGALAMGLCRAIIDRGGLDASFIANRTLGFEEFCAEAEPWTVQRTAEVCGLEPETIEALADQLMTDPRVVLKLGQGMQRHGAGGQAARTISCIAALIGAFDHRGAGVFYSTDPVYRFNRSKAGGQELAQGRRRSLAMTNLVANLNDLDDPPVEALFVVGANPAVSNPDTEGVRKALARPGLFTVVVDIALTETASYADLVLPSTMQHEQWELNHSFAHTYLNLNLPAVPAAGDCLPHTEIYRRLARELGMTHPALYATDEELLEDLLDVDEYSEAGITLDVLKKQGWVAMPGSEGYHPMAERFPTPSGRFEFRSERADRDGHGAVVSYVAPREATDLSHGYALIAAGSDRYLNSVFAGTDQVRGGGGPPPLRMNVDDAKREGVVDGSRVVVSNGRGSFEAEVKLDAHLRQGLVATDKGWWGMGVNATVQEADSDMGRGAVFHDNRVSVALVPQR